MRIQIIATLIKENKLGQNKMEKFKNLKVVISGQFGNGAEYKYGYPLVPNTDDPQNNWIKMDMVEKDPLDARNYFPQVAGPIYKMRVSTYGSYYALVAPCKYDTSGRNGYYSITLFVAKGTKYTGRQVRMTLNALNVLLYEANNFDESASTLVEQCFEQNGWSTEAQEQLIMPVKSVPAYKDAYREYETEDDLDTIMQYSMQPEYTGCRWIYLVETGVEPESQLSKLTTRIRMRYDIECPNEDIKVNKAATIDGDLLNIVYGKPNFDDYTVSVKVGTPESKKYLNYAAGKVVVKSAEEAGVVFEKSIRVLLFDTDGKAIKTIPRITVNDVPSPGSVVKVKDSDLGSKLHIKIVAGLYEDAEDEIDANLLVKAPQMRVTLKPRVGGVKLNVNIGGKEFSCVETVSPSDPLSQSLQRGTFNGYKVTRRQNTDEYDIDVTSGRSAAVGGGSRISPRGGDDSNRNPIFARIILIVVTFAIGIGAGVILGLSLSSTEESANTENVEMADSVKPEESALIDTKKDVVVQEEVQPEEVKVEEPAEEPKPEEKPVDETKPAETPAAPTVNAIKYETLTADEKADLAYLKKADKWEPTKVKSQRFKDMFTQLNNGNIDCLVPLFSGLADEHVNGYAKAVVKNIPNLSADQKEKSKKYLKVNDKGYIPMSWAAKNVGK